MNVVEFYDIFCALHVDTRQRNESCAVNDQSRIARLSGISTAIVSHLVSTCTKVIRKEIHCDADIEIIITPTSTGGNKVKKFARVPDDDDVFY